MKQLKKTYYKLFCLFMLFQISLSCEKEPTLSNTHSNTETKTNNKRYLSNGLILSNISKQEIKHEVVRKAIEK